MAAVIIALVAGVFAGALVVWLVTHGHGQRNPAVMQSQGEIKARLDEALVQVQRLGAIFASAGQRGRAGELVLENLLEDAIGFTVCFVPAEDLLSAAYDQRPERPLPPRLLMELLCTL